MVVLACEPEYALLHHSTAFHADRILQRSSDLEVCLHDFLQRRHRPVRWRNLDLVHHICPGSNLGLRLLRGQWCLVAFRQLQSPLRLTT